MGRGFNSITSQNILFKRYAKRKNKSQQSNLFGPNRDLNSNANSKSNEPLRKFLGQSGPRSHKKNRKQTSRRYSNWKDGERFGKFEKSVFERTYENKEEKTLYGFERTYGYKRSLI